MDFSQDQSNQPLLSAGQVVKGEQGSYEVIQPLNGGAFACVFLVEALDKRTQYILKLNPPGKEHEYEMLQAVRNLLGQESRSKDLYPLDLVAEPVDRLIESIGRFKGHIETVARGEACKDSQPNERQALEIATQVALLLQACARYKIAYRDIKPLDHVYWRAGQRRVDITLIDWNIAVKDAQPAELCEDLLAFCSRLPEIFTGAIQQEGPSILHPLGWTMETQTDALGRRLSYAAWSLLNTFSLAWGLPRHRGLRELVSAENPVWQQDDEGAYCAVEEAWQTIIDELQITMNLYQAGAQPQADTDEADLVSLRWASLHPDQYDGGWVAAQQRAKSLFGGERKRLGMDINQLRLGGIDSQIDNKLHRCRQLAPQDQPLALAWAAFGLRKAVFDQGGSDWVELTINLIIGKPLEMQGRFEQTVQQLRNELDQRLKSLPGSGLIDIYREQAEHLLQEIGIWLQREQAAALTDLSTRYKAASALAGAHPVHPLVRWDLDIIKGHVGLSQQVEEKVQDLLQAYRRGDLAKTRQACDEVRYDLDKISQAGADAQRQLPQESQIRALLRRIEDHLLAFDTAVKALDSWDPAYLEQVLAGLVLPGGSRPRKVWCDALDRRLALAQGLQTLQHEMKGQLQTGVPRDSEQARRNADAIQMYAAQIKILQADLQAEDKRRLWPSQAVHPTQLPRLPYEESLRPVKDAWQQLYDYTTSALLNWSQQLPSGQAAETIPGQQLDGLITNLEQMKAALDDLSQARQDFPGPSAERIPVSTGLQNLVLYLEPLRERRAALKVSFTRLLNQPEPDLERIAGAYRDLPGSLQTEMDEQYRTGCYNLAYQTILAAVQKNDLEQARQVYARYCELFSPDQDRKSELGQPIERAQQIQLASQAQSLLSQAPWDWQTQAARLLAQIEPVKETDARLDQSWAALSQALQDHTLESRLMALEGKLDELVSRPVAVAPVVPVPPTIPEPELEPELPARTPWMRYALAGLIILLLCVAAVLVIPGVRSRAGMIFGLGQNQPTTPIETVAEAGLPAAATEPAAPPTLPPPPTQPVLTSPTPEANVIVPSEAPTPVATATPTQPAPVALTPFAATVGLANAQVFTQALNAPGNLLWQYALEPGATASITITGAPQNGFYPIRASFLVLDSRIGPARGISNQKQMLMEGAKLYDPAPPKKPQALTVPYIYPPEADQTPRMEMLEKQNAQDPENHFYYVILTGWIQQTDVVLPSAQ